MDNKKNQSFLDSKTIMAIILSAAVFLVWNSWMKKKYPNLNQEKVVTDLNLQESKIVKEKKIQEIISKDTEIIKNNDKNFLPEDLIHYENKNVSFDISSKGMGVKNIKLLNFLTRDKKAIRLGSNKKQISFATNLMGRSQPIDFNVIQKTKTIFEGRAKVNNIKILKVMEINEENYSINTSIKVNGDVENIVGITSSLAEDIFQKKSGGMLSSDRFNIQEFFIDYGTDNDERELINGEEDKSLPYNNVNLASISSQYFALALINKSDILPKVEALVSSKNQGALIKFYYNILNKTDVFHINYKAYLGPKSLSVLETVNAKLPQIIDYGFFGAIGKVMQRVLKFFYKYTGNWGFSIILLTILVRLLVLPTALSSYKSMKNMAKINPLLKDLKEKYKDDPAARNQAMMQLYKEHKINPVGGCLPMLLQLPVFFALYQVLGQSIDLYQTPFIFWIQDLSAKDPYYVLPVLMGVTMFVQQKITPSTMDPAQARIMLIMPLVFAIMMASLPSGLTLYIFISGLFGIFQQFYFMRDKQKNLIKINGVKVSN